MASFLKGNMYLCICHSLSSQFLNQLQPPNQRSSSELISPWAPLLFPCCQPLPLAEPFLVLSHFPFSHPINHKGLLTLLPEYLSLHPHCHASVGLLGSLHQSTTKWVDQTTELYYLMVLEAGNPELGRSDSFYRLWGKDLLQISLLGLWTATLKFTCRSCIFTLSSFCVQISHFLLVDWLAILYRMWDLSSLTRDETHTLCNGSTVLTTGPPEKSPNFPFL